jgi:hypothetical protein
MLPAVAIKPKSQLKTLREQVRHAKEQIALTRHYPGRRRSHARWVTPPGVSDAAALRHITSIAEEPFLPQQPVEPRQWR